MNALAALLAQAAAQTVGPAAAAVQTAGAAAAQAAAVPSVAAAAAPAAAPALTALPAAIAAAPAAIAAAPTLAAPALQAAAALGSGASALPASSATFTSILWLLAIPAALALLALLLRRRPEQERLLQILETQSLGGRRALILAQLGNEALLLSSSEAGVTLLAARPAPQPRPAAAAQASSKAAAEARRSFGRALLERLIPSREPSFGPAPAANAPATSSFGALLEETADDQELRRKLTQGRRGRVA
jgi:flagellar protein FliO/FliZ